MSFSLGSQLPDFDRHHLHSVRKAFLSLNKARLEMARNNMMEYQQLFIDILPALLHFNHPMLPGYVSHRTPSGLYNFRLDENQQNQLRRITKSFYPNRYQESKNDILALFAMGSFGSIAQNSNSDIDLWVCYRPNLSTKALVELQKKCDRICLWAKSFLLDVSLFLMNHQSFQSEERLAFDKEASGSTQHFLLLDEFYRTMVHLGGQLPLWLFMQSEQEKDYDQTAKALVHQRLLPDQHVIDFGPIRQIPASEFISSAIWQLYKAIDSPYKSIIKLLLLEIYCREFNELHLLSGIFKDQLHAINQNTLSFWCADTYIQTFNYIENYLVKTNQHKRLVFLRRCFYFKLEQSLSQEKPSPKTSKLRELTKYWQWDDDYIQHLDNHSNWPLSDILDERRAIITELNYSYQFIMEFFRSQHGKLQASNRELNILGRKLHAAFSRKEGKIDWVNPVVCKKIAEDTLIFREQVSRGVWSAYDQQKKLITSKASSIELLTWLHCNQVLTSYTQLFLNHYGHKSNWLQSIYKIIAKLIPIPLKAAKHCVFEQSCRLEKLAFFIDFSTQQTKNGSSFTIDFSRFVDIEYISINSWNEILVEHKKGPLLETLLAVYSELLHRETNHFSPEILCFCPDQNLECKLIKILGHLFNRTSEFFQQFSRGRYLTHINHRYLMITMQKEAVRLNWFDTERKLKHQLKEPLSYCSPVAMDKITMSDHSLFLFAGYYKPNSIQIFFNPRGNAGDLLIIDEMGTWFEASVTSHHLDVLKPVHRFLRAITKRHHDHPNSELGPMDIMPINFYRLMHNESGWTTKAYAITSQVEKCSGQALYAMAEHRAGELQFTIQCNDVLYSEAKDGPMIYKKIAKYLRSRQQEQNISEYYIADLDLSLCRAKVSKTGSLQTCHYLKYKDLLEVRIDRELSLL